MNISTHSPARGLTPFFLALRLRSGYFNSQPRKGADQIYSDNWWDKLISTHSPARGLTDHADASGYDH